MEKLNKCRLACLIMAVLSITAAILFTGRIKAQAAPAGATDVTATKADTLYSGTLGSKESDWYMLTTNSDTVYYTFYQEGDRRVYIYDEDGMSIFNMYYDASKRCKLEKNAKYYIKVFNDSPYTEEKYSMKYTITADEPDTMAEAKAVIAGPSCRGNLFDGKQDEDWYKFTTSGDCCYYDFHVVNDASSTGWLKFSVYTEENVEVDSINVYSGEATEVTYKLDKNKNYYIRLTGDSAGYSNDYSFSFNVYGDVADEMKDAGTVLPNQRYDESICAAGDADWYLIDKHYYGKVELSCVNSSQDGSATAAIVDADGVVIKSTTVGKEKKETVTAQLDYGKKYYIKIENKNYTGDYNFSYTAKNAYYNVVDDGGEWTGSSYTYGGRKLINTFFCDGTYTYYLQADGTPMKNRLTYHPDGEHVIYFDENGHEVFSNYAHVKQSIAGEAVDDYCFFDTNGYLYVDVLTWNLAGDQLLYANPCGVLERNGWFQFSKKVKWADGTLLRNTYVYDQFGQLWYMQGNGVRR